MFVLTQIVGIVITFYVLIVWSLNRKLDSFTDRIFIFATIETLISQFLDILCQVFMSKAYFDVGEFWITTILKLYLISIPLYIVCIALYSNKVVFKDEKYIKTLKILLSYTLFNIIVVCFLPVSYIYDPRCSLPTGIGVTYTYIITLISCIILAVELIYFRKRIDRYAFYASLLWLGIFLLGGLAQFVFINVLYIPVVSLMLGTGVLVLYIIIENPGNKFDYNSNVYHFETFVDYINEVITSNDMQSVLYISLFEVNGDNRLYSKDVFEKLVMLFEDDYSVKIFSGYSNELIVTAKLFLNIKLVADKVCNCIFDVEADNPNVNFKASIVMLPDINTHIDSYSVLREMFDDYQADSKLPEKINIFTIADDICKQYNNDANIAKSIDDAIRNNRINLNYQIISNTKDDNLLNFESNVELIADDGSVLNYAKYYKVISKYKKYIQIDEIAFEKVCGMLKTVDIKKIGYVLVRISIQALEEDNIVKKYIDIIKEKNIDTTKICFELTNVDTITNKDVLLANIESLHSIGTSFAIGGFGSGESNLNYFIDLPMQIIKFDKSILNNALENDNAYRIMKDITSLAHSLDYVVIADGVENEDCKKCAEKCNVDMMIGKYYYDSMSEDDFIQRINNGEIVC